MYLPTSVESPEPWLLRVRGNPEQARQALVERLTAIDPTGIQIVSLQALARLQTYPLKIGFWVSVVLGGLALVLTVSGVFSVLSYVVEQQAKEIGVRMALGAATKNIVRLILWQSVRPVGIGLAAGGGLATAVAIVLMTTPIAAEIGDSIDVLDPVAYTASLLVIVASCVLAVSFPALRPLASIRSRPSERTKGPREDPAEPPHSERIASSRRTRAARHAGIAAARTPATASRHVAPAAIPPSVGESP